MPEEREAALMHREIIPEGKFNSVLRIGCTCRRAISDENFLTLALIVSDTFDAIADPVLAALERSAAIDEEHQISIADLGCLISAQFGLDPAGTQIALALPPWSLQHEMAVQRASLMLLSRSFREFIDRYERDASWLFPIRFTAAPRNFDGAWITESGAAKLRYLSLRILSEHTACLGKIGQRISVVLQSLSQGEMSAAHVAEMRDVVGLLNVTGRGTSQGKTFRPVGKAQDSAL